METNETTQHGYFYKDGQCVGHIQCAGATLSLTYQGITKLFEWHDYLGPQFVTKTGKEIDAPSENSKWWKGFKLWHDQGKITKNRVCVFSERQPVTPTPAPPAPQE